MVAVPCGYHGRYLRIDLTNRRAEAVALSADVLRRFIGGGGLGAWLLLQEGVDSSSLSGHDDENPGLRGGLAALAPAAPLAFVFSPLVGSPLTTSAKFAVVAQSPLTGRLNDSLSSSYFAIAGKKTGYDALVIVGAAESPTCLVIEPDRLAPGDGVRFEDATAVWGKTISETAAALRTQLGSRFRTAVIGPAGENLVRFASVSHDGRHAGRGGHGAVMGSKNLKAVAVCGDRTTTFAHPKELSKFAKELSRLSMGPATAKYRELGTVSNLLTFNRLGTLPTRNFQQSTFADAKRLSPEVISETHVRTRESCAACTIGCEHIFQLKGSADGESADVGVRLEYENLFAFGPLCDISDPDVVLAASRLCDEWGMDTISAGATVAFAMECAERGLIDEPQLRFGDGEALLRTLKQIGAREGLGELLSQGTRAAAREIGRGAEDFAPHVKGLEIPGYEPRALQAMALGFAVGARGADHNRSGAYQVDFSEEFDRMDAGPDVVPAAIETENEAAVMDSLILCKFLRGVFDDRLASMAEMLSLVTGWNVTAAELTETAARIVSIRKLYNVRQGWTPAEDTLPRRFLNESIPTGASAGAALSENKLDAMIRSYNLARGWSEEGWLPDEMVASVCGEFKMTSGVR
jgi:aldehyde:ferredoxin oxidoreductase